MPTHFGPFQLDEQTRELRLEGEVLPLQPRVFDVLAYLIRHRARVVGKEELLNTLWPDVIVTDASLQRAISLIRATLRRGGCEEAVQTRARHGYRFALEERVKTPPPTQVAPPSESSDHGSSLLEREPFVVELQQRLRQSQSGKGQAVFVSGEAGIGKSALVASFLSGAGNGVPVYQGYCDALFTPRAFGAILDVAEQLTPAKGEAVQPDLPRHELFPLLFRLLQAQRDGAILVLEDLHWADEATLDFVRFLGRRIGTSHCLLLATYRDDELGSRHLLTRTLGDLAGPQVTRQRLQPLSAAAVATLASEARQDGARVFALTAGNPFLVRELMSSPAADVPATVRDSMMARLSRCSAAARKVCELVALLPGRAEMDLVLAVLGDVPEAVDETIARGVISHERGALSYRHELARRAIENVLPPAHSRRIHAQILASLRERNADVARLVHHARCAGDRAAVLALSPVAAKRAITVGAHHEAAAQYATALAFADELPLAQRAELLESHAYECYLTSQFKDAVDSATAALAGSRELDDRVTQGRLLRFLSRQHWFLGGSLKAERFATEAIAVLEPLPPTRELAMAYSNRSQLGMLKAQLPTAVTYGERAVALARHLHDAEVEVHALNNIGTARVNAGEMEGAEQLKRSLELSLAHNLHEHVARAYVNLATCAMLHQNTVARTYLAEGLAYCEERDLDAWSTYLRAHQARVDLDNGEWDRAAATVDRLMQGITTAPVAKIPALIVQALLDVRRGLPGGDGLLDEALELALATDETQRIAPVAAARAEAAWYRNDLEAVVREADRGLGHVQTRGYRWLAGELLVWKSKAQPVTNAPPWVPEPYQQALAGDWAGAAAGFAEHDMVYERALQLARGDAEARSLSGELLGRMGAKATLAAMERYGQ